MRKRIRLLGALLASTLLTGCVARTNTNVVNISILNSKPEIQKNIEEAVEKFSDQYPEIRIKVVQYSRSQEVKDKMESMQNQGNTPTIMIVDPLYIQNTKEDLLPLNEEKWVENMRVTMGQSALNTSNELIAFPFALECMGFIYNKEVMDEAGVNVAEITTREKLEEAFQKVEATGRKAVVISNEDWSLSNHFLTTAFTLQSEKAEDVLKYIDDLKKGSVDLKADIKVNGLLDTFDLMKKHNIYESAPLIPTAEKCAELLATKQAGFWYMGNWASGDLSKYTNDTANLAMMPVPIGSNGQDYGNDMLMGVIKYLVIDQKNNSPEQQEAAKQFLNWLVYDEAGQNFLVNEAGLIPGASGNELVYQDALAKSIQSYQENDKVAEQVMAYLPDHNITSVGSLMRQYLNNEIDREKLLEEIAAAWQR